MVPEEIKNCTSLGKISFKKNNKGNHVSPTGNYAEQGGYSDSSLNLRFSIFFLFEMFIAYIVYLVRI